MIGECYLFFAGYHSVAAASDVLNRYHIDNKVVRSPAMMNDCCSFAVLINECDAEMSKAVLGDRNVKILCR